MPPTSGEKASLSGTIIGPADERAKFVRIANQVLDVAIADETINARASDGLFGNSADTRKNATSRSVA